MEIDRDRVHVGHGARAGGGHHRPRGRARDRRSGDVRDEEPRLVGWRPHVRRHGGGAGAARRHPHGARRELDVHSLHGYFLRPSRPGSTATHRVERVRDGRSFSSRDVTTEVEGRTTFRMHLLVPRARSGGRLPAADGPRRAAARRGRSDSRRRFLFDIRELRATNRREDGTYASTCRCWFRTLGSGCPTTRPCTPASWPTCPI